MMKWVALTGCGLLLVGGIGLGALHTSGHDVAWQQPWVMSLSANPRQAGDKAVDEVKKSDAAGIQNLQVTTDTAEVSIQAGTGTNITSHLYGDVAGNPKQALQFTVHRTGNQLVVQVRHVWQPSVQLGYHRGLHLDISVPQRLYQGLSVQADTGRVSITRLRTQATTVHLTTGEATISNTTGNLTVTGDTGAITADHVQGTLNLSTHTGEVSVTESQILHDITAITNTGAVDITVERAPNALSYQLSTSVGEASVDLPNAHNTKVSNSHITGSVGSGGPMVTAKSDVGEISLRAN